MGEFARGWQLGIDFFTDFGKSDEQKMLERLVKKLIDNDNLIWKKKSDRFVCITKNPIQRFTLSREWLSGCGYAYSLYVESEGYKGKAEGFWVAELWEKVENNYKEDEKTELQKIIDSF